MFKDKCIVIAPLLNPDGFLASSPTRVNANGVDLNRNFPQRTGRQKRFVNGCQGENQAPTIGGQTGIRTGTLFQMALIKRSPQKILSAHSPLNFFDYDGPSSDWIPSNNGWNNCKETNHPLNKFGYYPGSLGNYAGHERNIFNPDSGTALSDPGVAVSISKSFNHLF